MARLRMAPTKSPNRSVPSFRMYLANREPMMDELSWNPTSNKASRSRSAFKMPVFSFVCDLKAFCQYLMLQIRSLNSLNEILPKPLASKAKITCRQTSRLAQLLM